MTKYGKLYPVSFGFAWGIIHGLGWLFLAWAGARWGFALPAVQLASHVFHGVAATLMGGIWAFCWGFLSMFVTGILVAMIYNCSSKCFCPSGQCE